MGAAHCIIGSTIEWWVRFPGFGMRAPLISRANHWQRIQEISGDIADSVGKAAVSRTKPPREVSPTAELGQLIAGFSSVMKELIND